MTEHVDTGLATPASRRYFLRTAGVAGLAVAGAGLFGAPTAAAADNADAVKAILTVARTAEQLAITFYVNGLKHSHELGLDYVDQMDLIAAVKEEQLHQEFFTAGGGASLADTFSFPEGDRTFTDLRTFIATQQQLEGVFDSAFLAAVKEFSQLGEHRLAQIAAQIACIESEHRALGRAILGRRGFQEFIPADNWAYAPVLVAKVADAPGLVQEAGFLSPTAGNSFHYRRVNTADDNIQFRTPFTVAGD